MTVSRLRVAKSETRELGERDRVFMGRRPLGEPTDWQMSNQTFFIAFVAILAALAMLALAIR